jgi:hypothetical protein
MMDSRLQRYDVFPKVVSIAYGKCASKAKQKTANNQRIMKTSSPRPMENRY